ncbi:hypothetical protein [Pleionea sediminis]|uniref:hypothetical protein n=1 Tax=Pleionea sediminis TaxID=2569479 RepID=UPI001185662E|nr:hypothetical protein [Pleionea sediminis]
MSDVLLLKTKANTLAQRAVSVSAKVEQGQAQTPLSDRFTNNMKELEDGHFSILLLTLNSDAKQSALKWLCGHSFSVFNLNTNQQLGLLEISLKDKGFSYESENGTRKEFNQWDTLMESLESDTNLSHSDTEALKLSLTSENQLKNLTILVPSSIEKIQSLPALYTKVVRSANLLAVAGTPWQSLESNEQQLLKALSEEIPCIWPLFVVDELKDNAPIPENGWWTLFPKMKHLPPLLLTQHVSPSLPDFLAESKSPLRQALGIERVLSKMESTSDALKREYEAKLKQLNSKKNNEQRKQKGQGSTNTDMSQLRTQLSNGINERTTSLSKSIQAKSKKIELSSSSIMSDLATFLESISLKDLSQNKEYKQIHLSINDQYEMDLKRFIKKATSKEIKQILDETKGVISETTSWLSIELEGSTNNRIKELTASMSFDDVWHDIDDYLSVDLKYQGELPKRNFFDRLSEGRRSAFVILMLATLLGYMGFNVRTSAWLGWIIIPVFIGSIVYTYSSWKQQDEMRIKKELQKIQNETANKSKRLISDLLRENNQRINNQLDQIKRSLNQIVDDVTSKERESKQFQADSERSKSQQRVSAIDAQIRQMEQQQMEINSIVREFATLKDSLISDINKVIGTLING